MKRARIGLAVLTGVALAGGLAISYLARADASSDLPNVRGNIPRGGNHTDTRWVKPLLDAGYCISFHYDRKGGPIDQGDGKFEEIFDTYYIFDEDLGSAPNGRTVTVSVGGTPLGGPTVDWDSMPVVCP